MKVEETPTVARAWTDAQRAAIAARRRTLVAAAAGSGKTSVLTELVAQALVAREVAPADVCAVTFTERAAQEMRGRVAQRLLELGELELLAQLELARIGTIHSLCAAILRRHGTAVGVDPGVGILDEAQAAWLQRDALATALRELSANSDVHWLRARTGDDRIEATLAGIHRCAAQSDGWAQLTSADELRIAVDPKSGASMLAPAEARRALGAISLVWERFHQHLLGHRKALGRISYDDLERLAVEAVRVPAVRADLRARWTMVLVDEFQDTNQRQYELLHAIGHDRLFMVGDEWQSIYRFRGADVDVFRARRSDPSAVVLPMRDNFRSAGPVLEVVNRVFGHEAVFGELYEPVVPGTDAQRSAQGPAVELLVTPCEHLDGALVPEDGSGRAREAARVAEHVARLVESGAAGPADIAILYARGTGAAEYEAALAAWGLPVLRAASGGYYDQRDVRDALAVLALARNRADDAACLAVLAGPVGRLEWHELDALVAASRGSGSSLLDAARGSDVDGATRVVAVLDSLEHLAVTSGLVALVSAVVGLPELEVGAAAEADGRMRVANLRRLVELAASAAAVDVTDVAGFLEFVDAQRRDARVGEASIADETVGAVRLLTVHASKGLEFPYVYVVEAGQGGSGRPDLVPEPHRGLDGRVHVALPRDDGRCIRTADLEDLASSEAAALREEQLRLWYVAMTRARTHLVVSGRWDFTPTKAGKPRAMSGALAWLRDSLDLPDDLGGVDRTSCIDGLVTLDTRPAREHPRRVWDAPAPHTQLAAPLDLPHAPGTSPAADDRLDPAALRTALRDAISAGAADERRRADGTRLHHGIARLLDAARAGTHLDELLDPDTGPWLPTSTRDRLAPLVASPVFRTLARVGARTEVPYVAGRGDTVASRVAPGVDVAADASDIDAGRMDAVAVLPDGTWWVADWKMTLPDDAAAAWRAHGAQLARYAAVAHAAGAPITVLTLVSVADPDVSFTWHVPAGSPAAVSSQPPLGALPG